MPKNNDDDDRVDGRERPEPREPGSDALLLAGLLRWLSSWLTKRDGEHEPF